MYQTEQYADIWTEMVSSSYKLARRIVKWKGQTQAVNVCALDETATTRETYGEKEIAFYLDATSFV